MDTKPWYKSKITLLSLSGLLVFGSNLLAGWLTGAGVTPEQLDALQAAQPQVVNAVERIQQGEQILGVIGSLLSVGFGVFRVWFTSTKIG